MTVFFRIDHRVARFDTSFRDRVRVDDITNHLLVLIQSFFFFLILISLLAKIVLSRLSLGLGASESLSINSL